MRVGVTVTFLRMDRPPDRAGAAAAARAAAGARRRADAWRSTVICTTRSAPITSGGCGARCRTRDLAALLARSAGVDPRAVWRRRAGRLLRTGRSRLAGRQPELFRPDAACGRAPAPAPRSCARRWPKPGGGGRAGMTVNTCTADHRARAADLSARRLPPGAPGARDVERAGAAGAAHSRRAEDLTDAGRHRPRRTDDSEGGSIRYVIDAVSRVTSGHALSVYVIPSRPGPAAFGSRSGWVS